MLASGRTPANKALPNTSVERGRRADEVALEHAEIALPDRRDAIEDHDEQDASREDAGGQEIKVAQVSGRHTTDLCHHLAKSRSHSTGCTAGYFIRPHRKKKLLPAALGLVSLP